MQKANQRGASQLWPERDLEDSPVALANFKQLCKCCDRYELGLILMRLTTPRMQRRDSWTEAANGLSLADLDKVAKQAGQLAEDARALAQRVNDLRSTVLVKKLVDHGQIQRGDLLHPSTVPKPLVADLGCMTRIGDLARSADIGPAKTPNFHEDIRHLMNYVKGCTGEYHDTKLEQILAALGIHVKLKQYRFDRKRAPTKR